MSQADEDVEIVEPKQDEDDVPKYLKDRQRRQFMVEMAANQPEATFAEISAFFRKPCGNNFNPNFAKYSIFFLNSFWWLHLSVIQTSPCLWQARRMGLRARSVLRWVLFQARSEIKKVPRYSHYQSFCVSGRSAEQVAACAHCSHGREAGKRDERERSKGRAPEEEGETSEWV